MPGRSVQTSMDHDHQLERNTISDVKPVKLSPTETVNFIHVLQRSLRIKLLTTSPFCIRIHAVDIKVS